MFDNSHFTVVVLPVLLTLYVAKNTLVIEGLIVAELLYPVFVTA